MFVTQFAGTPEMHVGTGRAFGYRLTSSLFSLLSTTLLFPSQVPKWVYWWSLPKLRNGQLLQYVYFLSLSALRLKHAQSMLCSCRFILFSNLEIREMCCFWGSCFYFFVWLLPYLLLACRAFNLVLLRWNINLKLWVDKILPRKEI